MVLSPMSFQWNRYASWKASQLDDMGPPFTRPHINNNHTVATISAVGYLRQCVCVSVSISVRVVVVEPPEASPKFHRTVSSKAVLSSTQFEDKKHARHKSQAVSGGPTGTSGPDCVVTFGASERQTSL